jgi:hypothetical protein
MHLPARLPCSLSALFISSLLLRLAAADGGKCSAPIVVTADQLKSLSQHVCADAAACKQAATQFSSPGDCSTADDAAQGITAAFAKYQVVSVSYAAAAISNMITQVRFRAPRLETFF